MPTAPRDFPHLSVHGAGSWADPPIPKHMPLHFMVNSFHEGAALISVDGDGNHALIQTRPMPVIHGGRVMATTSFGSGPLIFVDFTDLLVHGTCPVPAGYYRSVFELINATCAALRRPCPSRSFRYYYDDDGKLQPPAGHEHMAAELQPPAEQPAGASSSKGLPNTPTCEVTSPSCPRARAVTSGSPILAKRRNEWGVEFFIRVDREGSYNTYPDVGGPFRSVEQAEGAIDRYLEDRRVPSMCEEKAGVSKVEMVIRQCVFWPDGKRKRRTKSHVLEKVRDHMRDLVHAVVDQYNEDHNLTGDFAYEPKDILQNEYFSENNMWYRHLNFIAKTKVVYDEDDDVVDEILDDDDDDDDDEVDDDLLCWVNKLFFLELKETKKEGVNAEWVVSCFCMLGPLDNGPCYACTNGVKHPNKVDAYTASHVPADPVSGGLPAMWSDSDEEEDAKERRIRRSYELMDQRPFVLPWYATPKVKKI